MLKKTILTVTGLLFLASFAMAAPVKVPGGGKDKGVLANFADGKLLLSAGAEYDNVFERKLDASNGEVEFQAISGEIALEYDKNVKGYVTLGQARDIQVKFSEATDSLKFDLEDNFIWGVGLSAKSPALEVVDIFTNLSYRQMTGMDYESVNLNGTTYTKSQLGGKADTEWKEWHVAVGVSKDFEFITPYAGVRYSDVEASGKITISGTDYDLGSANADNNFGLFVGTRISPIKDINIDIQGRFIDETALMVSASWLF